MSERYRRKRGRWPAFAWFVGAMSLGLPLGILLTKSFSGTVLVIAAVVSGLACATSMYFLARYSSRRLHQLYAHAQKLASESTARDVHDSSGDELDDAKRLIDSIAEASRDANDQLHRTNRLSSLGSLSAAMTHEVRNPLTGLLGFIQLARSKHTKPERVPELIAHAESEANRCRAIIDRFLDYSRREHRAEEPLDLSEIVAQATDLFVHHLKMKQIRLVTDLAEDVPAIKGVASELHQVLLNLVLNAGDATPEGGAVMITTRRTEGGGAQIEVSDTGNGIPADLRAHIFEPFFTTKGNAGTGLGLSVSQQLIRAHQGTITLSQDSSSSGATFLIEFPASAEQVVVDELAAKRSGRG